MAGVYQGAGEVMDDRIPTGQLKAAPGGLAGVGYPSGVDARTICILIIISPEPFA
jgi:hypothetical protein